MRPDLDFMILLDALSLQGNTGKAFFRFQTIACHPEILPLPPLVGLTTTQLTP
jgi:hypothetical protein